MFSKNQLVYLRAWDIIGHIDRINEDGSYVIQYDKDKFYHAWGAEIEAYVLSPAGLTQEEENELFSGSPTIQISDIDYDAIEESLPKRKL